MVKIRFGILRHKNGKNKLVTNVFEKWAILLGLFNQTHFVQNYFISRDKL